MGTKKGQYRKTSRRAYKKSSKKRKPIRVGLKSTRYKWAGEIRHYYKKGQPNKLGQRFYSRK